MHDYDNRLRDVQRFYAILSDLEHRLGGTRTLATANGRLGWPQRGIYLFFEPGQVRSASGSGLRVVREGTPTTAAGGAWRRLFCAAFLALMPQERASHGQPNRSLSVPSDLRALNSGSPARPQWFCEALGVCRSADRT